MYASVPLPLPLPRHILLAADRVAAAESGLPISESEPKYALGKMSPSSSGTCVFWFGLTGVLSIATSRDTYCQTARERYPIPSPTDDMFLTPLDFIVWGGPLSATTRKLHYVAEPHVRTPFGNQPEWLQEIKRARLLRKWGWATPGLDVGSDSAVAMKAAIPSAIPASDSVARRISWLYLVGSTVRNVPLLAPELGFQFVRIRRVRIGRGMGQTLGLVVVRRSKSFNATLQAAFYEQSPWQLRGLFGKWRDAW
ncbi:hypothetical protein BDK51DRAFT_25934 [Blyttiomyces helicus]|uniref:Uncharacterized protein n=1 Tax=Blyttiomyces helicus TaxID=388810 RepID=A0A4P9VZ75_9FUNG|nr:hypothetical protein BDK51DRAFT_25934 [Blyttiomyces helicus]|eukprot:RKO84612.1 hypothetical protein BDK51DRAFT_25934 [Blyttiomyces helicus]